MDHSEGVIPAPASTAAPQELLEEMLWFFRVEDGKGWGIRGGGGGVCLSTKGGIWLKPPDTVASASAGCTFPPQGGD